MGEMKIFVLVCMLFVVYGADESIPKPTAADGPEFVEVEGERSPDDIDQELEAVYAVNQSEPLNLDETDEDISDTDIDLDESYEDVDEELVEGELSPEDDGGETATIFKSEKAPIDFESLNEAEPKMVEEKDVLGDGQEVDGSAVYAKNVSAPINFDEAAPVKAEELVEIEGDDQVEEFGDDGPAMVEEGVMATGDIKEGKAEYATGELPPLDLNE